MWTLMVVVVLITTTTGCPVIIGTCLKLAQSFMDAKEGVIKADQKYLVVLWNVSIINTTRKKGVQKWRTAEQPEGQKIYKRWQNHPFVNFLKSYQKILKTRQFLSCSLFNNNMWRKLVVCRFLLRFLQSVYVCHICKNQSVELL